MAARQYIFESTDCFARLQGLQDGRLDLSEVCVLCMLIKLCYIDAYYSKVRNSYK